MSDRRDTIHLVLVGEVDHGKSTLVGRLMHETGSLPEGKLEAARAMSARRGRTMEWAFLLDAFQAERDQGVTIDATHIWIRTPDRDYAVIDAPGHVEFVRNMVTGAAQSDAALLLIDAAEGVSRQTRRHGMLLRLLGLRQVVVAVNKMDLVGFDEARFAALGEECARYLAELGLPPAAIVPVAAQDGDNVAAPSPRLGWHRGPTLLQALAALAPAAPPGSQPLRMPVQDVYRLPDRRIVVGRIESGSLAAGDTVLFSPANRTAVVRRIERWPDLHPGGPAGAGESIGLTFDEQVFVERGAMLSHLEQPPLETNVLRATLFWLSPRPLTVDAQYTLRVGTAQARVSVQEIESLTDIETLAPVAATEVGRNAIAQVVLRSPEMLALDDFAGLPRTGRFVLIDRHEVVAGGTVTLEGIPDQRKLLTRRATNITEVAHAVTPARRTARNGHAGLVVWLTGLSGSGKSTLAMALERRLFETGHQTYVLDGDNVRAGLNADLGFSDAERVENIRRVAEVAALFADAGLIVITAFISPFRAGRDHARIAARARFREIYVKASLAACEARDPKGLYRKARRGDIADFTGISAGYEEPERPDLVIDTEAEDVEACVARLFDYVSAQARGGEQAE